MLKGSKYTCELLSPEGVLLADLSGIARDRSVVKSRNESDEIAWQLDLNELERYAASMGVDPTAMLVVGYTEVRIKRGNSYISGGQLTYVKPRVTATDAVVEIRASGFLSLFNQRYTDAVRTFTATEATDIAWTLIDESQNLTNGNYGITRGLVATVGTHDRTYRRTNLQDALKNLTKVQSAPFDMEFTPEKVFNTYASIGSERPEIIFEYPSNIVEFSVPNDATGLANQVIALGAGIGDEAVPVVVAEDLPSQLDYKLRQKVITTNGTDDSDGGVTDAASAELAAWSVPIEMPTITVDGNRPPFYTDYGIGDRVRIRISGYKLLDHINGMYRIEKSELRIDDNDNELVRLYVTV